MLRNFSGSLLVFAVLLIGGCASVPERIAELDSARDLVAEVNRDPMAEKVAGAELAAAREALQRAETIKNDRGDIEDIRHQAYLATRHAEIVMERIAEATARERIERSEEDRNRVVLDARTAEAERATAMAEARGREAEQQAREAERQRRLAEAAQQEAEELARSLEELKAKQTERGLVLTLGDVLFDSNASELKPGAFATLDRLAEFMRENKERRLLIEGHTDSRGEDAYNQALSQRRAEAVQVALIARGVDASRLRAVGLGEAYPVASNDQSAGRQENRRVEIVVSDTEGEFPDSAERSAAVR